MPTRSNTPVPMQPTVYSTVDAHGYQWHMSVTPGTNHWGAWSAIMAAARAV